jgi:phenylalanyl-tRNA synthetase beta chain
LIDGRSVGWIGELHPRLQQRYELPKAAVCFELELEPLLAVGLPRYREVPKFQALLRDVSVTVAESVPVQALLDAVHAAAASDGRLTCLREFRLFDLYRPRDDAAAGLKEGAKLLSEKEKSLAFTVRLQDPSRALADADADAAMAAIVAALETQGARLRQ